VAVGRRGLKGRHFSALRRASVKINWEREGSRRVSLPWQRHGQFSFEPVARKRGLFDVRIEEKQNVLRPPAFAR
jgi:hypothetical protein